MKFLISTVLAIVLAASTLTPAFACKGNCGHSSKHHATVVHHSVVHHSLTHHFKHL